MHQRQKEIEKLHNIIRLQPFPPQHKQAIKWQGKSYKDKSSNDVYIVYLLSDSC